MRNRLSHQHRFLEGNLHEKWIMKWKNVSFLVMLVTNFTSYYYSMMWLI
jgi:hypothetical protein